MDSGGLGLTKVEYSTIAGRQVEHEVPTGPFLLSEVAEERQHVLLWYQIVYHGRYAEAGVDLAVQSQCLEASAQGRPSTLSCVACSGGHTRISSLLQRLQSHFVTPAIVFVSRRIGRVSAVLMLSVVLGSPVSHLRPHLDVEQQQHLQQDAEAEN